jgi:hypothetical protein
MLTLLLLLLVTGCGKQTAVPTLTLPPPTPTSTATPRPPNPTPPPNVHLGQPGDSLSAIARRYGLSVKELVQANGIEDANVIRVGQELVIPGPTPVTTATVPPTLTPTPPVPPEFEIVDVVARGAPGAETVIIANRGRDVLLAGWTLRDAQGNVFVFPKLHLAGGTEVRIHTGRGENTPLHLFWDRDTAVWGDAGDTIVLADERGVIHASKTLN